MSKTLRVISLNFSFGDRNVTHDSIDSNTALFDFDVVVIRPPQFTTSGGDRGVFRTLQSMMSTKARELDALFAQGGVLVVFLDVPDEYGASFQERYGSRDKTVTNYDFLDTAFASCLRIGTGRQITYDDPTEPFVSVLKRSTVGWTTYLHKVPEYSHLRLLKLFARAGAGGAVAGKMSYKEGHIILLPLVTTLDEKAFLDACAEYRFKRQGTTPPHWTNDVLVPGLPPIVSQITDTDKKISDLQNTRRLLAQQLEERAAYRKLLYEKGKIQLEPIVLRALDDLEFGTSPSETIQGTNFEIDGRTKSGSMAGIVEVKGSKNQIAQSEFAPFVPKILADAQVANAYSKGILVGNGLCETAPQSRLGDKVFSSHVIAGARTTSVALVNSVELYWLCCTLLQGEPVDKVAVREAILTGNGYVDLKPFCSSTSPFTT